MESVARRASAPEVPQRLKPLKPLICVSTTRALRVPCAVALPTDTS